MLETKLPALPDKYRPTVFEQSDAGIFVISGRARIHPELGKIASQATIERPGHDRITISESVLILPDDVKEAGHRHQRGYARCV